MGFIPEQEAIGTSRFDLYLFRLLHWLTFKRSNYLQRMTRKIENDLDAIKQRKVF